MFASGWPITLLLFCLFDSATSSPVSTYTPASPLRLQISPPSPIPTIIPSLQSPSLSTPPPIPSFDSHSAQMTEDRHCTLTISPSALVVRFGDPATATCSAPNVHVEYLGWEIGDRSNQSPVLSVNSITKWDITPICIAMIENTVCPRPLSVIVYKPPDSVSITFANHTGPMFEGRQYTLQCTVLEVAPIGNLIVTFYRGQTELQRLQSSSNTTKEPVTETFTLDINPTKEDDGVQYWCEAKLDLGAEGPQPPPVVTSQKITTTVYYQPQLKGSSHPDPITVIAGSPLHLNCSSEGNPSPSYTWTLPSASRSPFSGDTLDIKSVTSVDGGQYLCLVQNAAGNVTVKFTVVFYNPPKNIHLSFLNHSGPMYMGHQYTLQCTVQEVPPIGNLTVTFYHGQTSLGQQNVKNKPVETPVNETFTLNINPSKEDDGDLYWCEAKLDLGAEGPHPPPVVTSQNITTTVYYKPQLKGSPDPERINVTEGDPLHLNCSSEGNPSPSYTWTLPSTSHFSGSTFSIEAVTSTDGGQYACLVRNSVGNVTKEFTVDVKALIQGQAGNYSLIIIFIVVVVAVTVLAALFFVRRKRRQRCQHFAVPVGE